MRNGGPFAAFAGRLIGFAGMMGAGKSTLARDLAKHVGLPYAPGPVIDEEQRALLLSNSERHAFPVQIALLTAQIGQQEALARAGAGGVQDRTLLEDAIYSRALAGQGIFSERELVVYETLFDTLVHKVALPDMIVFLDVSPAVALERVVARGRGRQVETSLAFLELLRDAYAPVLAMAAAWTRIVRLPSDTFRAAPEVAVALEAILAAPAR